MPEVETDSVQSQSGRTKKPSAPSTFLAALFAFAGSLTFGISLLAVLLVLMAWGTFIESKYGAAATRFVVYANPWFHSLIALLALNIAVSITRVLRRSNGGLMPPARVPFLTAHAGILFLLLGCYLTWQYGEEAQITLPEGTIGHVAVKPEQQRLEFKYVAHSSANVPQPLHFPLRLGPFSWQDYQYDQWIKDGKWYKNILWYAMQSGSRSLGEKKFHDHPGITVEILDYYAHSALEPVPPLDVSVLWNKTVQTFTEQGDAKEVPRNWEMTRLNGQQSAAGLSDVRGASAAMSQGERISYSLALTPDELTAFQQSRPSGGSESGLWGEIVLYYGGKHYHVNVDQMINFTDDHRFPVEDSGLQIGNVRFRDWGPIISFVVFTPSGEREAMTLFPDNPELNVQARRLGIFGSYWADPQRIMQQSAAHADHPMLQRLAGQRLDFMQGIDKKLYYRLWSGQKIVADGMVPDGVVPDRKGPKKPQFKIAGQTPDAADIVIERFVPQDVPGHRIVPALAERGQHNEQRIRLRVVFDGKEDLFWLRAVLPTVVPLPPEQDQVRYLYGNNRTLCVEFNFEAVDLGFGILLKNFEKRMEPGTRMPSHYSSLVDYVVPKDSAQNEVDLSDRATWFSRRHQDYRALPGGENILISMNRPGYFRGRESNGEWAAVLAGYRIYQSSYLGPFYPDQTQFHEFYDGTIFPWETLPRESIAMSTFSVNADPGRGCKYFGSFLIVLGVIGFVWRKH